MASGDRSIAWTLAFVLVAASFASFAPLGGAVAQTSELTCNGHARPVFLTTKPLQINPGKCRYFRINIRIRLQGPNMKPAPVCLFAKAWGNAKEYGPFCTDGPNFGMRVPGAIQWVWASQGLPGSVKFCKSPEDCR
jgi:hypothetical protein